MEKMLFMVEHGNAHVITFAVDRDSAARQGAVWLGLDPSKYTVTPLTEPGDRIKLDITLQV